jgi:putative ABC transport system permease protein
MQDVRFALRTLRQSPSFTAVVLLTLALGIAANTAIFSAVNAVIISPLRYPHSDRLMVILSTRKDNKEPFYSAQGVYSDWGERATSFERMAGAYPTRMVLNSVDQPHFANVGLASFSFFELLGTQPILGRTFTKEEDQWDKGTTALLDAAFWRREFGGDRSVIGHSIRLDDQSYTVIGVLPEGIRFANFGPQDIWIPLAPNPRFRGGGPVVGIGLLRPGVTQARAQSEMDSIMEQIRREHVEDSEAYAAVKPLRDWMVGGVRTSLLMLLGAVAFVLLICCANIASLMLARSTARHREMAIRSALGAGKLRLARFALTESFLLAAAGGMIGIVLAYAGVRAIPAIKAIAIPRVEEIAVDHRVLLFAIITTVFSGVLFGLAPAFQNMRLDLNAGLQRAAAPGPGRHRVRGALVAAQLALAMMLLTGAGLMLNSLVRLLNIELGFQKNIVTVSTSLPYQRYDQKRSAEFQSRLANEVARMPGVEAVAFADYPPLQAVHFPYRLSTNVSGARRVSDSEARHVSGGYLNVTGIPLLAGRDLEPSDDQRSPIPALINRTTEKALFGGINPIGRVIATNYRKQPLLEVVGLVGDARQLGLTIEPGPQIYLPASVGGSLGYLLARTNVASMAGFGASTRAMVHSIDPSLPAPDISSVQVAFSREVTKPIFYLALLGAFALTGLILASLGTYGLVSDNVARRTHEFGIRVALGAGPGDILGLVIGSGARLALVGVLLGAAGSIAVTRTLSSMLYAVQSNDPLTLATALLLLALVAMLACYPAARRATLMDPSAALRTE